MEEFWAIAVFFNPAKYNSLLNNYFVFSNRLKEQKVNLLTVELAFNDDEFQIPQTENVLRLRGNSIMWQKERLINYAVEHLPNSCKYYGWIDCDILFPTGWVEQTVQKLQTANIVQLFKKIWLMPQGVLVPTPSDRMFQGVVWQKKVHKNWLHRRKEKELPFSVPGFAWAARKDAYPDGIYDKNIVGSGDTFLVDCCFDSWAIHGYAMKFTDLMKKDMMDWKLSFDKLNNIVDYIPIDVCHLWHGSLKNRKYMDRHQAILDNNYDPAVDIKLENGVYEWNSPKHQMHEQIKHYFFERREDDNE